MKILFSRSNLLFSRLIRSVTQEDVSHIAVESPNGLFVLHSNFRGVHMELAENFRAKNEVVYEVEVDIPADKIISFLSEYEHSLYDFGAFLFLGISLILRGVFRVPLPKSNLWKSTGMFICTELVSHLLGKRDAMLTPGMLHKSLKDEYPQS